MFFAAILNARVYAFEPFPPNHALLELNIAANGLDDGIIASHHGIGETTGTATLHPGQPDNFGTTQVVVGSGEIPVRNHDTLPISGSNQASRMQRVLTRTGHAAL